MKKLFIVKSNGKNYRFEIKFHKSDNERTQQIEPDFYRKYSVSHKVHEGVHYEIEIISMEIEQHANFSKVHIHTSLKNDKKYVCWTGHLPTKTQALLVAQMWCAGTIFTIENGEDFGLLFDRHKVDVMNFEKMIKLLEDEYKILVSSLNI